MSINYKVYPKESIVVGTWSGGTTMQLAIYPSDAVYADRNFKWRLSSATVELEESTFTSLPQFNRILMILEGEMKLVHKGEHEAMLGQFDQDSFDGAFDTTSYGKVVDYNLMMSKDAKGSLEAIKLVDEYNICLDKFEGANDLDEAFYLYKGTASFELNDKQIDLSEGGLLTISKTASDVGSLKIKGNGVLIRSQVYFNK